MLNNNFQSEYSQSGCHSWLCSETDDYHDVKNGMLYMREIPKREEEIND